MAIAFGNYDSSLDPSNTTITLNKPSGTASGDVLIFIIALNDSNPDNSYVTPDTSFSIITYKSDSNSTGSVQAWYKVAGGSEPSTYTFSWSNTTSVVAIISNFTGCNTSSPISQTNGREETGNPDTRTNSITPSASGEAVIQAGMLDTTDRIGDALSNWRDGGTTYTWTQIVQDGDASNIVLMGAAYTLNVSTSSVEGWADLRSNHSSTQGIIFSLSPSGGGGGLTPPGNCYFVSGWISTPGTTYITLPFGTTGFLAKCWGGGGCGSAANKATSLKLAGGGGGGVAISKGGVFMGGTVVEMEVGAGGTSAGTNNGGNTRVTTWQWSNLYEIGFCGASGGKGVAVNTQTGGSPGYGNIFNFLSFSGGTGATTTGGSTGGGGGGGGAGDSANGGNGSVSSGGSGGAFFGQSGGSGRSLTAGAGNSPSVGGYGGGGGGAWGNGASSFTGGNGGNGAIYYEYYSMCDASQGLFETN